MTRLVGPDVEVLAVVKANAYGHGAVGVARLLEEEGCAFFGVATAEEAHELRDAGIRSPILVLGGIFRGDHEAVIQRNLTPVLWNEDQVELLERSIGRRSRVVPVHVKVDTGMGRLGADEKDLKTLAARLKKSPVLRCEGLMSHLSNAESVEGEATREQLARFQSALAALRENGIEPRWKHLSNSAAVVTWPAAHFNLVRPGLMLYGASPSEEIAKRVELRPVMRLRTEIVQLRHVPPGFPVSYGHTFVTKRQSLLATLPIGYADGLSRLMSNRGEILVGGRRAPIVGRVCMDLVVVDVTDVQGVREGDEAVLIGAQQGNALGVDEVAKWSETIPYEIFTAIGHRVSRFFVES